MVHYGEIMGRKPPFIESPKSEPPEGRQLHNELEEEK